MVNTTLEHGERHRASGEYRVVESANIEVIAEGFLTAAYTLRLRYTTGWPNFQGRLLICGIGVASFSIPFTLMGSLPLVLVLPGSVTLYALVLLIFPQTRNNELHILFDTFRASRRGPALPHDHISGRE